MKTIGILVGDQENWKFFQEIFDDLSAHYQTIVHRYKAYETPLLRGKLNRWMYHRDIRSILRQSDVCFFEWASDLLVTASRMPKYCPIVTRLHSYELYAWAPKINWDNVDKVILVSQAMREKFSDLYPDHAHKTEVVYNAKPLDQFKPVERNFSCQLGMLCSINPAKRIYEIVLLVNDLKQQGYDAHLNIAGERLHAPYFDEYYVALQRLVQKLDLEKQVTFDGYTTDTVSWLQKIDIFISNSYWEGHQVALVEAMATGCYCLSHFWDGAEEVLPPKNLYVTDADLLQKIVEYSDLPDDDKSKRQAQMRALACENYDIENAKARIRRTLEEVLAS